MNIFTNYHFNFYAVPVGFAAISVLAVGLIVFLQNTRSNTSLFFALSCFSVFLWLSGYSIAYLSKDAATAVFWFKNYAQIGIVTIAPNIYFFVKALTKSLENKKRLIIFIYSLALIFYLLGYSPDFFTGVTKYFWGWYSSFGHLAYFFLAYFLVLMLAALRDLWLSQGKMKLAIENKRIKVVFIAILLGYTAGLDFLPAFKIGLYPFGYFIIFMWLSLIGYAIVRYKLMILTPEVVAEHVISIIPDFLILVDREGKIIMVNRAIEKAIGYKKEELIKKPVEVIISQKDVAELLFSELEKKETVTNLETTYRSKDGKEIPVIYSGSVIRNDVGDIAGFVVTALDITERKRSEEELKIAYEKLRKTQEQLLQNAKMASLGQLAGGIAHEVNNPLSGVMNNIQILKMMLESGTAIDYKQLKDICGVVESSALRCKLIVKSLLDFSHAAKGMFKPVQLNIVISQILGVLGKEMELDNVTIQTEYQPVMPDIQGDPQLLQQMIAGLLMNARWAINERHDKTARIIIIRTWSNPNENMAYLSVSDNGIGMPQENIPRIFEPFFTTKEVGEGTGLGLALIYKIVENHNATIKVESQVGMGTTFIISFPLGR
ncbi:MAG: PAS domain S-box protein [Candidatus Omnitrophica bacterium]|nr:PAS domain S-box protein [Candidatus Omnitrophota bacterium]